MCIKRTLNLLMIFDPAEKVAKNLREKVINEKVTGKESFLPLLLCAKHFGL
jgi:hypothetical protein